MASKETAPLVGIEPRALTIDELRYVISAIPLNWPIPEKTEPSVNQFRRALGIVAADDVRTFLSATQGAEFHKLSDKQKKERAQAALANLKVAPRSTKVKFAVFWNAAFEETRTMALRQLRVHLTSQLTQASFKIAPVMIDVLRDNIIHHFNTSRVSPGDTVGVLAAEALGGPVQQMTLNSFHASGTARNIAGGVGGISELINLTKDRSMPSCTIHFVKPPTFVEALRKEADFVGLSVGNLALEAPAIYATSTFTPEPWYEDWIALTGQVPPQDSQWVLRLTLDTSLMLNHGVLITDVVRTVEKAGTVRCVGSPSHIGIVDVYPSKVAISAALAEEAKKGKKKVDLFTALAGEEAEPAESEPTEDEALERAAQQAASEAAPSVQPIENEVDLKKALAAAKREATRARTQVRKAGIEKKKASNTSDPLDAQPLVGALGEAQEGVTAFSGNDRSDFSTLMFLQAHIMPWLDKTIIKGVPGITQLFTVETPVWSVVDDERSLGGNLWSVHVNHRRMRVKGITLEELNKLMALCQIEVVKELDPDTRIINVRTTEPIRPGKVILNQVEKVSQAYNDAIKKASQAGKIGQVLRQDYPLLDAALHLTCDTSGTNLAGLFQRRDVDATRTYSNNVHEIAATLGIGAARTFLMTEFYAAITNAGSYVQPRHLMTICDFMTVRGVPLSVSFSALSKRKTHTLALATNQQSMKVFANAAVMGKREAVVGASAQIMINRVGNYGTGSMGIRMRNDKRTEMIAGMEEANAAAASEETLAEDLVVEYGPTEATPLPSRLAPKPRKINRRSVDDVMAALGAAPQTFAQPEATLSGNDFGLDALLGIAPVEHPPLQTPNVVMAKVTTTAEAAPMLESRPLDIETKTKAVVNPELVRLARNIQVPGVILGDAVPDLPVPGEKIASVQEKPARKGRAKSAPPAPEPAPEAPAPTKRKLAPLKGKVGAVNIGELLASIPVDLDAALHNPVNLG